MLLEELLSEEMKNKSNHMHHLENTETRSLEQEYRTSVPDPQDNIDSRTQRATQVSAAPSILAMRADYIPFTAAHSDNISYAIGNHSSRTLATRTHNTIVVLPSIDLDMQELTRIATNPEHYEERQLYHLLLLIRDPSFRIIFITSKEINQDTIKYYLTLDGCSNSVLMERRSRLFLFSPEVIQGSKCCSLSEKVIRSEKLLNAIRSAVENASIEEFSTAGISYFCGSNAADQITSKLKIRSLEARGRDQFFGCKQGSRFLFQTCGVPCSPGTPDFDDDDLLRTPKNGHLWSMDHRFICKPTDLSLGIARQIILRDVTNTKWVIKLNQGFSGKGNASLDIETVQSKISRDSNGKALMDDVNMMVYEIAVDIETKFPQMKFECGEISWCGDTKRASFIDQMSRLGAIAEAYIEGPCVASPSVQAVVDPALEGADRVKILSTHEQVLSGQIYSGCINPANPAYRTLLVEYTKKIGGKLAEYNIVTHFSVDFVATNTHVDGSGRWNIIGIEINLRQGGTTHPYSTMATLCGGQISPDGVFQTKEGKERCYEATDNFFDNRLIGVESSAFLSEYLQSSDPLVIKLRWNQEQKVGVVFHLLPLLQVGKLGFTAIAETPHQASALFKGAVEMLDSMANKLNASR